MYVFRLSKKCEKHLWKNDSINKVESQLPTTENISLIDAFKTFC